MKQMWKRYLALVLAFAMAFSLAACSSGETQTTAAPTEAATEAETAGEETGAYEDGTFTGSAYGMHGDVPVTVTVENGKITDITVGENDENPNYGGLAIEQLPAAMIEAQSPDVDVVSGATVTSEALIQAVKIALGLEEAEGAQTGEVTSADVIVVGAGLSGLVAACRTAELGGSVILMEQSGAVGGSSRYAGGYVSGACTHIQEEAGVEDSFELAYEDIVTIGGEGTFNPDLAWMHVQRAGELVNWLSEGLGVELSEPGYGVYTPTNVPRVYEVAGTGGIFSDAVMEQLNTYIEAGTATLLLNTEATSLTTDDSGRVTGVVDANGVEYSANDVILATGGYGYNEEWVQEYNFAHSKSSSPETATGSGYDLAQSVGASFSNMEYLPAYAGAVDTDDDTYSLTVTADTQGWSGAIWVDLNGSRLADEVDFTTVERQQAWENAEENYVYIVFTDAMMDSADTPLFDVDADAGNWDRFQEELEKGYCVFSGSTVEELAENAGIDPAGLAETIEKYNGYVEAGEDADFGRTQNLMSFDSAETYYAVRTVPYILLTKGGVDVNTAGQVLREDGTAIEGLYACGELIGGANIGGHGSHGGMAHAICFVWGTIAAESAVSDVKGEEVHVEGYTPVSTEVPEA